MLVKDHQLFVSLSALVLYYEDRCGLNIILKNLAKR